MFGQVIIGCNQNPEADLAGYRIYCGTPPNLPIVLNFLQEFPLASLSNPAAPSMTITTFPIQPLGCCTLRSRRMIPATMRVTFLPSCPWPWRRS